MDFNFNLKSSFLLIFFFHGLVFTVLLLVKGLRNGEKSAYWLSFFTLLCTCYISPFMLGYAGWYAENPYRTFLFYAPLQQLLLLPPVLYCYCKSLFDRSFVFGKRDWLHFVPALLYGLYSLVVWVTDCLVLHEAYFYADEKDKDFSFWYQLLGYVSLIFYLLACLRLYKTYKGITYNTVSYADTLTFTWAQQFLVALLVLGISMIGRMIECNYHVCLGRGFVLWCSLQASLPAMPPLTHR